MLFLFQLDSTNTKSVQRYSKLLNPKNFSVVFFHLH